MVSRWSPSRRVRTAMGTALLAVSLSVTAVPALAVPSASAVSLVDWSDATGSYGRYGGWSGGGQGTYEQQSESPDARVDSDPATASQSKGVVLINTVLGYEDAAGAGTGVVLTADGEVVTNYHVVEGATSIKVTVASTGKTYAATVVGHSATTDVALLKLTDATSLPTATVDDDTLGTGDTVTAVGNAEGTGTLTAAKGTVTDLSTSITTASEGSVASEELTGLIETTADVVPGDSGGPLIDHEGEVVGLDVAASNGSTSATIDGYAIPIADALAVVEQILTGESTATVEVGAKAFLGVQVTDTATAVSPGASYDGSSYTGSGGAAAGGGAGVAAVVDGSPAARAGLEVGDTITAVGSTAVTSASDLSTALGRYGVGDRVQVTWTDAAGDSAHTTVTLAASPTA
ncbi:S1C family serine protease [uncultured Friedmanniella sp.]|uniref:S1C family serine protease n=1 Tax=uncultured Friedmanniella sp. TaxID=335381 RepID=UPI0035C99DF4